MVHHFSWQFDRVLEVKKMNRISLTIWKHESLHIGRGFSRFYTFFEEVVEYRGICADDENFAFLRDFEKLYIVQ